MCVNAFELHPLVEIAVPENPRLWLNTVYQLIYSIYRALIVGVI